MVLNDKIAIVTGSGGPGCGRAVALRLAREGCSVVVSDINDAGGAETLRLIEAGGGRAALQHVNVRVASEVEALVAFAEQRFGGLDIVVNNASAPYRPGEPMEHWAEILEADLLGPMNAVLLPGLLCGGAAAESSSISVPPRRSAMATNTVPCPRTMSPRPP